MRKKLTLFITFLCLSASLSYSFDDGLKSYHIVVEELSLGAADDRNEERSFVVQVFINYDKDFMRFKSRYIGETLRMTISQDQFQVPPSELFILPLYKILDFQNEYPNKDVFVTLRICDVSTYPKKCLAKVSRSVETLPVSDSYIYISGNSSQINLGYDIKVEGKQ